MSKVKKILAMLMAVVMTLGMCVTAFAANGTATITVSGLASTGTNTVKYYKILTPDVNAASGYKITDGVTLKDFTDAKTFIDAGVDNQKAALLDKSSVLGTGTEVTPSPDNTTFTATVEAGYYAVFITNTPAEGDPEIVYTNPMIVSVEYNKATKVEGGYEYDAVQGVNSSVVAKYTTIPTTKTADDEDGVVEIGREVTYTVKTYVPSGDMEYYTITDTLTGADYVENSETVTIGDDEVTPDSVVYDTESDPQTLTITLTNHVKGNEGKLVVITYKAIVTDTRVNNTVVPGDGTHSFNPDEKWLFTGAIKLTKTGEGDDASGLNNAKFVVYRDSDSKFLNIKEDGSYEWVEDEANAEIFTTNTVNGDNGVIVINGLDKGKYWFKEVEAPEGYSINTQPVDVTIDDDNLTSETIQVANPAGNSMADTKLSSLPSTGGIGTTIFTIGGCAIMIVAAGLYFATRKKTEK